MVGRSCCFFPVAAQHIMVGTHGRSCSPYGGREANKEIGRGQNPNIPFKDTTPSNLTSSH
jgi:hypothetical protein